MRTGLNRAGLTFPHLRGERGKWLRTDFTCRFWGVVTLFVMKRKMKEETKGDDENGKSEEEGRLSERQNLKKTYIVPGIPEISLFLLPEKVNVQVLHQRRELICDVLQRLGACSQGVQ